MNDKRKMNLPYKLAFVCLILCLPIFAASIILAYLVENINASVICSAVGVLLATVGIILACVSKEKKIEAKADSIDDFDENKITETIDKT